MCVSVKVEKRQWTKPLWGKRGGLKTFLNWKCFLAFILFYYLHNYLKYMLIILFTIHRVTCNYIFWVVNPLTGGGGGICTYESKYMMIVNFPFECLLADCIIKKLTKSTGQWICISDTRSHTDRKQTLLFYKIKYGKLTLGSQMRVIYSNP